MRNAFYVSVVCLFLACNRKVPFGILQQDKMEILLWEQIRADVFTKEFLVNKNTNNIAFENVKLQQKIFAKYGVDKKIFYKSYQYYLQHEELLKPLIDSIVSKQTRIRDIETLKKYQSLQPINWQAPFSPTTPKKLPPYQLKGIFILIDSASTLKKEDKKTDFKLFNLKQKRKNGLKILQAEEEIKLVE